MGENADSRKMTSRFLDDGEQVRQGGNLLLFPTGRVRDCLQGRRRCRCAAASAAPPPAGKRAPAGGASAQGEAADAAKCRLGHRNLKTFKGVKFQMGHRHFGARGAAFPPPPGRPKGAMGGARLAQEIHDAELEL